MDIYAIVTDKIINLLEQGVVPWRRPWTSAGLPRNLVSKKPYRGINHFLLSASKYVSPFWLTMRQANELGGHVRKGEESTIVVFWKVEDAKQSTEDLDNETADAKARRRFLLRYYRVFNLEQCELPQAVLDKLPKSRRTSTIRSKRPNGSSPQCPTRRRFSTQAQRRSTARLPIESLCHRASFSRALKNTTPQRCMRPCTAPAIRSALREKGFAKSLRSVPPSTQKKNCARKWEPPTFARKPALQPQSSRIRPRTWPAGSRSSAMIASS